MYLCVILVGAIKFARIVNVKERKPRVLLPFDDFAVLLRTLLRAEAWLISRAWIDVASFVTCTFTDTEGSAMDGSWVVTLAGLH